MSMDRKVPEIRFKGFSEEWVGSNLGGLIDIRSAARVHKEQWTEAGIPFFRTSDVVSIYKGQENTKAYISKEVYHGLSEKIGKVTKNDLLITGGGSIGIPYLVPNDNPLYFKDADLLWLKNNEKFNGYFLYTFFFSEPFKKHIKSISHTGTIAHYTIEQAKATPINTCCDEEQTQIGNYFQKLDVLINQHQQKHNKLSNIKKSMLEKMFPKKGETIPEIRFKGFSGGWDEISLLDSIERIIDFRGRTPKKLGLDWSPSGYRALSALNVKQGYIDFSIDPHFGDQELYDKWMNGSELHQGQVLFTTEAPMGNVAQVPNTDKYILSQRTIAFVVNFEIIVEDFLAVLLRSYNVFRELSALSSGGTAKGVSQKVLANLNVCIPTDLVEQTAIGNYFQKLDVLINQHQQQITKLNNIKQACLSKMFV
ncbi:restriction endonuclease subunit S [Klebsiella quasipneumoniae]|uniref:restriction endonuclease subunit S n=1 Tax=Klebsiella quasipneumoniae TaxID=1463165 RepID=UPI0039753179